MTLLPLLFCSLFVTVAGLATGTMYTILTVPLLLVAIGALSLTLAPNAVWFFRDRFRESVDSTRKPPLLEDVHMRPIRQLVAQEKFEDACVRLESLLKNYRADFSELQLMTQLYHQVNRNKEAQSCALEMIRALQGRDFRVGSQVDRRAPLDALNQVAGHPLRQAIAPDQHVDALGGLGQKDGGLSRRIASAHDDHFFASAHLRLDERGAVVHTGTFEPRGSYFSQASLIPHATSATTTRTATSGRALCHGGRAVEEREGSMREVVFMRVSRICRSRK